MTPTTPSPIPEGWMLVPKSWQPIMDEIERRADKMSGDSRFTVEIDADDIESINATPSPISDQAAGEPIAEIINVYGDPEAFAERAVAIIGNAYQSLPIGTKLYARSTAPTTGSAPAGNTITCPHYGACSMEICLQENACTLRRPAAPASLAVSVLTDEQISTIVDEFDACHWVDGECRIEERDMMKLCRALLAASMGGDKS